MQYDEFVTRVHQRTDLRSQAAAALAAQATLEALGQYLTEEEASDLAAQLPMELQGYLQFSGPQPEERSFDDFITNVSLREETDRPAAARHVRAVIAVLCQAVSIGELANVLKQLPPEFIPFFETEHPGLSRGNAGG